MHPLYLLDEDVEAAVRAASAYRQGMLPEAGGLLEQAALTMASITVVIGAWNKLETARLEKERARHG